MARLDLTPEAIHRWVVAQRPEIDPGKSDCKINHDSTGNYANVTDWTKATEGKEVKFAYGYTLMYHGLPVGVFHCVNK